MLPESSCEVQPHQEHGQNSDDVLTPLRAHYLKKTLISLQFGHELSGLASPSSHPSVSPLSYLGRPFTPPPEGTPPLDFPFTRYIFRQFVLTFPFLASAPEDFFPQKLQPFLASLLSRNLAAVSPFDEDSEKYELATREKVISKIQKQLTLFLGSATKLIEHEEVVRLSQRDLEHLENLARRRRARELKSKDFFDVNVVSVRTVVDKGRVRSRIHEEFLVRTRRSHRPDIVVSRRYGDFRTLANELRKAHPDAIVPSPPAKDRTTVSAPVASPNGSSSFQNVQSDSTSSVNSIESVAFSVRLVRERNRLTLRSYLHSLLSSSTFASSPVLRSFLLSGPTRLTSSEIEDARRREEADQLREEGRKRFARELADKVDVLREATKNVKGDIMGKDGLHNLLAIIKQTSDVRDLPQNFKSVLEWGRISLASTIFQHFVAADSASESLASLKRIHGLMPYFMLKGILKISNPMAMIRGVLDLFLAQPFGGHSLLQRMFTSSMTEEVKALQEDIQAVQEKIDDPVFCEKIRLFVNAPPEIQAMLRNDAETENIDILTVILRSSEAPTLSRAQMHRVLRAHRAHAEYIRHRESLVDSDDDDGPQNDDAWLFEDLTILGKLHSRLRDREQLMELIFEGTTSELLKDIITILYAPLAQVYKAASIADSLGDLQAFINDLVRTVEGVEISRQAPAETVKMFIALVHRHEQSFYNFVHKVHSKGAGLFDSLMRWIELFLSTMREGIGEPISLEYLLPHKGQELRDILAELDSVALYHYRLKLAYESKVRKRFMRGDASRNSRGGMGANEDDEATQALMDSVVRDFNLGDLVREDAEDFAAEESDSEESGEEESDTETETGSDAESTESEGAQSVPIPTRMPSTLRGPASARLANEKVSSQSSAIPQEKASEHRTGPRRAISLRSLKSTDARVAQAITNDAVPPLPSLPPLHLEASEHIPPPVRSATLSTAETRTLRGNERTGDKGAVANHTGSGPRMPRKKSAPEIQPPELKHIPGLLPLFREVIRPLLRPRQL